MSSRPACSNSTNRANQGLRCSYLILAGLCNREDRNQLRRGLLLVEFTLDPPGKLLFEQCARQHKTFALLEDGNQEAHIDLRIPICS